MSMTWNMADLFESVVDAVPDRVGLVVPDAPGGRLVLTYAELDARINRLAHALLDRGVGPGDKVAIYGYNGNAWVEAQWAAWKIRAAAVNVNFRYVEAELRYLFENCDAAAIVAGAEFAPRIAGVRDGLPHLRTVLAYEDGSGTDVVANGAEDYDAALAAASPERGFEQRSDDDLYLLYTGGTTGMPKGVMWRQEDFFKATIGPILTLTEGPLERPEEVAERAPGRVPTVQFPLAPLMHGAAQWVATSAQLGGNTIVLSTARRMEPNRVWHVIADEKVQSISIVGDAQARPLADELAEIGDDVDVSSLVIVGSGGAILSPAVKDRLTELLPNTFIVDALGASETGFQGPNIGNDEHGRPKFVFGEHTMVLDEQGAPTTPGDGVVGRLARHGHIPLGYYKDEAKTAETFTVIDGRRYVIPGDMAMVEVDGTITLLGRGSVSINSGGEKIFPEEVELALKGHPEVFDVVVVGVPDERWGERVVAVVSARGDARPPVSDLADHARQFVAGYKVPREVHYVSEVVRSPSGKADYRWAKSVATGELKPD
jgi:acyl-CoA synthetase (AMP-forming)/AMP-acid ligase II